MGEGDVLLASDLCREHHGWLIQYERPGFDRNDPLTGPQWREILFSGVRRWTYEGEDRVGLLDATPSGPFRATEHNVWPNTRCVLGRPVKRGVPRPRKGDYPREDPR